MSPESDELPPSLVMVAAGGIAVLLVVAFVAAVALGSRSVPADEGDRLAVARGDGPAGAEVLVHRCPDERVVSVEVLGAGGEPVWRITSRKGSIDTRYVVGGGSPTGFATEVPIEGPLPEGPLAVVVGIDDGTGDRVALAAADIPAEGVRHRGAAVAEDEFRRRALGAVECAGASDRGTVSLLFAAAAAVVALSYLGLVRRWWLGRPGS
ncbi:MAG TPA: hypothetical protein VMN58_13315 [Acidimicrobiales bacterium]|nr:hypothetical protein [Acidimicrobiales bacterium]